MDITLETLTPIWTGDHTGKKCEELKLTGLTGSIRWWYEAMIRGLGGWACDPTGKADRIEKCSYESLDDPQNKTEKKLNLMVSNGIIQEADRKKYAYKAGFYTLDRGKLKPRVCEACKLFGCSGWCKTFRMRVSDVNLDLEQHSEHNAGKSLITINGNKGYMVPFGRVGNFILRVSSIGIRDPEADRKVLVVLRLALRYGALGAKTHLGYGVLKCLEEKSTLPENFDIKTTINAIVRDFSLNSGAGVSTHKLPVLTDFIFARLHPQSGKMPVRAPLQFRYDWRNELRTFRTLGCTQQESYHLRHYFCGIISNPKCKRCHEFLEMQETNGLTFNETVQRLHKIRQLNRHEFMGLTIDKVVNEALENSNLDSIKKKFGISPKKLMNKNEFVKYLKYRIPSYFCAKCNDKKINWEYKNEPITKFNGVEYAKIASHQFTSRIYKNGEGNVEMRAWAWLPSVLDKFFTNARKVTQDKYINFVKKKYAAKPIECYHGQEPSQWLTDLLNK
jgi:CRISPR type III-B/RAMP module RAMP protein Cmr1